MAAAKMLLPCPMCVHKPERYEDVEGGACTTKGVSKVANVIQHLITYHLKICRICGVLLIVSTNDKSASRYKSIVDEHKSTNCHPRNRSSMSDPKQPEILTEAQEEIVLNWTRKNGLVMCDKADLSTEEKQEQAAYGILYAKLHNKPLPDGAIAASYWIPAHKAKRKIEDLERQLDAYREEARARDQAPRNFRDESLSHVASRWEKDPLPRPSQLDPDLLGDGAYVNPQNIMKDSERRAPTGTRNEILKVNLEQTLAPSLFVGHDLSDSAYSSNGPDS